MSRVGNKQISIPLGTTIIVKEKEIEVSGVKGKMIVSLQDGIKIDLEDKIIKVNRLSDSSKAKALHGLVRSEINNAVIGVSTGWSKVLKLVGVGFRAQTDGKKLTLNVGYSHPVDVIADDGVTFSVKGNEVTVAGFDKQKIGVIASNIRRVKPPEVYKGKGIRYKDEVIKTKPGKAAKAVGTTVAK